MQVKLKDKPAAMNAVDAIHKFLLAIATWLSLSVLAHGAEPVALDGDNWSVAPQAEVSATGEQISTPGFTADKWLTAQVPGTVFGSYVLAGKEQYDRASAGGQDATLAVECWNNYPKLDPPPPDPSNLALSRPVTASSSELEARPENAVDGDFLTSWRSRPKTVQPEWLCVDLGKSTGFGRLAIKWEGEGFPKSYEVQASDDAQTWTSVYQTTKGQGGLDNLNGLSGHGRYVRVFATDGGRYGYQISELEVYAK